MLRYLRLYGCFLRFAVSRAVEFRFDFFFRVVMDSVFYAAHLIFFAILYGHAESIAGWDLNDMLVFVAGFLFVDAVQMTFFSNNTWWFPFLINRGDLDYYLVRPVSVLFFVSLRDFAVNSAINLVMAGGILAWAIARHPADLGALNVGLYVAQLFLGGAIHYTLVMFFLIPVFWTHSAHGLRALYFSTMELGERPHLVYPLWMQRLLLSVFPAAMMSSYPAAMLLDGPTWWNIAHVAAVAGGIFGAMVLFWRRGLRAYGSASS